MGRCCQLLYDMLLPSDQACQSTFLSLDIKTFDNHALQMLKRGEKKTDSLVHCAY